MAVAGRTAARIALPLYLGAIYATLGVARVVTEHLRASGYLRLAVAAGFAIAAVTAVWAVVRDPLNRTPKVASALVGAAALYAAVVLPMQSPEEKLHFVQYGLVALLAWAAAPARVTGVLRPVFAALFTLAAGWVDEGIQGILPSRYYDLRDVAFNFAAGVMAVCVLEIIRHIRRRAAAPTAAPVSGADA